MNTQDTYMIIAKNVLDEIRRGENIDLYLMVSVSILLLLLDLFGLAKPEWLTSLNIAVLTLLAISLLVNRGQLEDIQQKLARSPQTVFLSSYPDNFLETVSKATELWIIGIVLSTTANEYSDIFIKIVSQGGKVRLLLVDPEDTAVKLSAARTSRGETPGSIRKKILVSLAKLCRVRETQNRGIEIRTVNYIPSFGIYGVDINTPKGTLYVEHYGYKLGDDIPKFVLYPNDVEWYKTFAEQLRCLWEDGDEWQYSESQTWAMITEQDEH